MAGLNRGVSTVVGYVLNLGIATLLVTGLLVSGATVVSDQRERTVRAELDVIGNRMAADLETADRLLRAGSGTVTVRSSLPETVAGSVYDIEIRATDGDVELVLEAREPSVSRTVPVRNGSAIQPTTVTGGELTVRNDTGTGETLVVNDG